MEQGNRAATAGFVMIVPEDDVEIVHMTECRQRTEIGCLDCAVGIIPCIGSAGDHGRTVKRTEFHQAGFHIPGSFPGALGGLVLIGKFRKPNIET